MRALSLLGVLIVAKATVLAGQPHGWSAWAAAAYFSQDALVALLAAVIDAATGRTRAGWALYGLAVAWIAVNVPVALVLGSPLTWPMLRAARGTLADSIAVYLTGGNVLRMLVCAATGVALPVLLRRLPMPVRVACVRGSAAGAVAVAALGPFAAARVDTAGLDRNALTALVPIASPAVAAANPAEWRLSPLPGGLDRLTASGGAPDAVGLTPYRGAAREMNLVMVVLESTGARYLRPYGALDDPMPYLTTLSENALVFEDAYAVYPESIKGLFATLCSRYPAFNQPAEAHAREPCASLAAQLREAGYRTALFHSGRFGYLGMDAVLANKGFDLLEDAGAIGGNVRSSFGVDESAAVDRLLGWIDSLSGARFFAAYLPIAGHHPYAAAGPYGAGDPLADYRNALHLADRALGRLLAGLHARGLDRSTLLVVFGDHGEAFGEHPGNIGHTLFVHDENVKVPYVIAVPGVTTGQTRVGRVASVIDTAPTVLDLVGLPLPAEYRGESLLRPAPRMALFFTDYALGWLGLRDGCWKYQLETSADRSKLFDVCRDPGETQDLTAIEPARAGAYRDRVRHWSAAELTLATRNAPPP